LPAVVGGSLAYVVPIAYIINDSSLQKISNDHEVKKDTRQDRFCFCMYIDNVVMFFLLQRFIHTMRAIQGALIVASSIQIILGYSQVWGLFSRYSLPLFLLLLSLSQFITCF
jgi:nucleobase transporter 1/2